MYSLTRPLKSWHPEFVVIDFETALHGRGSLDYWHPDFRVTSMAASWVAQDDSIRSVFERGEGACQFLCEHIARSGIRVVAHNAPFEMGVLICRFGLTLAWQADTIRLVQNYDNGGRDDFVMRSLDEQLDEAENGEGEKSKTGLGLGQAIRRILNEPDHKRIAHEWLRANINGCRKGREGQFLSQLPDEILRSYNVGDTEATLRLYLFLTRYFAKIGYDWRLDHQLYFATARKVVAAKIRGIRVLRPELLTYRDQVNDEINAIARDFSARFAREIALVERGHLLAKVKKLKTLRGRRNFIFRYRAGVPSARRVVVFNSGSNKQLSELFCGVMGMVARFQTAKGQPSFKSAHLGQWGEGGEILKARRKRLLVFKQCDSLARLSEFDGRWHLSLKLAAASSGRMAGGDQ